MSFSERDGKVYLWQLKRLESSFKTLLRQTSPAIEEKMTWEEVSTLQS